MSRFHHYSLVRLFLLSMGLVALINSATLWGFWYFESWTNFQEESQEIHQTLLDQRQKEIQREINAAVDFIDFKRLQVESRARQTLQYHVQEAYDIADHLYRSYSGKLPAEEVFSLIREALRTLRFNQGRGYFFATSMSGIEQLFADKPEMEGRDFLNVKDSRGVPIIREMIALVKRHGEGFYEYTWSKPNHSGRDYPKLSYIKHFPAADWFFGAGEYLDEMEAEVQREVLERLNKLRFGENGYIFVLDEQSTMLAHPLKPELVGRRMLEAGQPRLREIFPKLMEVSEETGSGFWHYRWAKPDGTESEKVTYVARYPEWGWLLGAGFHMDDAEALISLRREAVKKKVTTDLAVASALLCGLILLVFLVGNRLSRLTQRNLQTFNEFFASATSQVRHIEPDQVVFSEFDSIARSANLMIAERQRMEVENRALEGQLQQRQKLEAIGTLAGGIAHDFNNLLAAMFGNISLLQLKLDPKDPNLKFVQQLSSSALRARDLVQQILSFSRPTTTRREPLNLVQVIAEGVQLLRSSLPSTVDLQTDLPDQVCLVHADATQLHQVLMNLCTNAYQAFADGVGRISIQVRFLPGSMSGKGEIELLVCDNGPGITADQRPRIFDPFFTTKGVGEGTGLGLSVVHSIISSHNGSISVDSPPGEGCRFRILLPEARPVETGREGEVEKPLSANPGSIVLVDDEIAVLGAMEAVFQQLGCRVRAFADPLKALAYIHEEAAVDLLVTDLTMPGMTGLELAGRVKKHRPDLPVLLCTGYPERIAKQAERSGQIDRILHKPITLDELRQALADLLLGDSTGVEES